MKNLLKYCLVVLAMVASTGLLLADAPVKAVVDTSARVLVQDSSSYDSTVIAPLQQTAEVCGDDTQISEEQERESLWRLFIPAVIIIVLVLLFGVYKICVSEDNRKLFEEKKYLRLCAKVINNAISHDGLSIIGAISILLLLVAVSAFVTLLTIRWMDPSNYQELGLSRLGFIGDFSGGVIGTLVALIVAIYAIRTYRLERQQQKEAYVSAMLSTMLDLHKQNVKEIKINQTGGSSGFVSGRECFEQMYNELKDIYNDVIEAIQTEVYSDRDKYADWIDETKQKKLAHILSFGYFFYSVELYMIPKADDDANLYQLCEKAALSVRKESRDLQRHVILGHYYRHLYNMVNFIDKNEFSQKYQKKELYVKLIRSQLSDYEQILLYYDTLSLLGKEWNEPLGKKEISKMNLICKYRLIKNCPNYMYYFGLKPTEVYANEKEVWDNKKEYFLETDSKWQQEAFKEMLKSSIES